MIRNLRILLKIIIGGSKVEVMCDGDSSLWRCGIYRFPCE